MTAVASDAQVTLNWATASERNVDHYNVVRNGEVVANVPSLGDSPNGHSYTYVDRQVVNGTTYNYGLVSYDINGAVTTHTLTASATPRAGLSVANEYALHQNYPNPFNPTTSISYSLKEAGFVSLKVYSIDGREVATLVNGNQDANSYSVQL